MKKFLLLLSACLLLTASLVSCGDKKEDTPTQKPTVAATEGKGNSNNDMEVSIDDLFNK